MNNNEWSSDFSYIYYKKLLRMIKSNFEIIQMRETPHFFHKNLEKKPRLILRHDIDLDLDKALIMAKMESEFEISSCYMIMTNCPFYDIEDKSSQEIILRIKELGHEIALHFNVNNPKDKNIEIHFLTSEINDSVGILERIISQRVDSISFHQPSKYIIEGPFLLFDRVNAYSKELMEWYMSDSKGRWRNGEPLPMLENPQSKILQFLIHPIWWGEEHMSAADRLQEFFEIKTEGLSDNQIDAFNNKLLGHLKLRRSKN